MRQKIAGFFIFCSGANISVLEECPTEKTKYAGVGATIFFTAILAGLSGGYALFTVFQSLWLSIPFAFLWALMIFNLDRVIVSGMRKQKSFSRDVLFASPRILLAMLLAVVISKPLELKLFEKEVRAQMTRSQNEAYGRAVRTVDSAYGKLASLEAENQRLREEITSKQREINQSYREQIQEEEGTAGTGIPGPGPVFREKGRRLDEMKAQLSLLVTDNNSRIQQNETRIRTLRAERQRRIDEIDRDQAAADRFLAQLEALSQLNRSNGGARLASWFITLLFIALETAPVVVKLLSTLSPYRPYDQKLEDREWQIVESSERFRQALRSKLIAATDKEISEFKKNIETEITISSARNQQRLDAELQANQALLQRIAAAQTEIAEQIVDTWKAQELQRVDSDVSGYINVS